MNTMQVWVDITKTSENVEEDYTAVSGLPEDLTPKQGHAYYIILYISMVSSGTSQTRYQTPVNFAEHVRCSGHKQELVAQHCLALSQEQA